MRKLSELRKSDTATVKAIDGSAEFRKRLFSLGLTKGSRVQIKECNLGKQNIEIEVNGTLIALRSEEAQKIEVERDE
jgi:ferrous iron transport protein A